MLNRAMWVSVSVLLLLSFFLFTSLLPFSQKQRASTPLLTPNTPAQTEQNPVDQDPVDQDPAIQTRENVVRDLWIVSEKQRLHHRIKSLHSTLTASKRAGKRLELIEHLTGLKCFIQEAIEHSTQAPSQQLRYVTSKEGVYYYENQHFNSNKVFLALFRLPGEELPTNLNLEEAYLQGIARKVSLSLSDQTPQFHAKAFNAQINLHQTSPQIQKREEP